MRDLKIKKMTYCSLFTALICICSVIEINLYFTQIPITLQTYAIMVAGVVLGKKMGVVSVILYLFLGAIGLPVFAGLQSGLGVLLGPSGGFLIGFIPGVYIVGFLFEKGTLMNLDHIICSFFSMAIGLLIIYIFGAMWLMFVTDLNFIEAFSVGVLPFILLDCIKIFIAVVTCTYLEEHNIILYNSNTIGGK